MKFVFAPGARPNLIWEEVLQPDWHGAFRVENQRSPQTATSQEVSIGDTVSLHVWIWDSRVRVFLGVVRNLAVFALLGTSFIDKFVKGIFPSKQKIVLYNSAPAETLATIIRTKIDDKDGQDIDKISEEDAVMEDRYEVLRLIIVAKQTKISHRSEVTVLITTEAKRILKVDELPDWDLPHLWKNATGITDVFLNRAFYILIINTSSTPSNLPKH